MSFIKTVSGLLSAQKPGHPFNQGGIKRPFEIEISDEWQHILDQLEHTKQHVFVTGRAGTGKSTLLDYFRSITKKRIAVLAFTGVAAVNVEGQTIHSFFGFTPGVTLSRIRAFDEDETVLYRNLDMIIIDEISMVRADLLDCVDKFLRMNGPQKNVPFGGIQMVFVGDLYQLEPIVANDEKEIFETAYKSPFFFDAKVFNKIGFVTYELTKIYRQSDAVFKDILESVRLGGTDESKLDHLNEKCVTDITDEKHGNYIYLVTTNNQASQINTRRLGQLQTEAHKFVGVLTGKFREKSLPTDMELVLKEGACVMLLNNDSDGRWVNGDIATVENISVTPAATAIKVRLENGKVEQVLQNVWEEIRYFYNKQTKQVDSEVVGTFTQYPLRLAWAVTIHKGQGKTFDRVVVDFGRGTFAHGQAYVALSRATSMNGLALRFPVELGHTRINTRVTEFMEQIRKGGNIGQTSVF